MRTNSPMMSEPEKKEFIHVQNSPYRFQTNTYAPVTVTDPITKKKTCGKGRFSVEVMVYIAGVGWDIVDITNAGNELLIALYKYVKTHEILLGYEHVGLNSEKMKNVLENLWQKKIE